MKSFSTLASIGLAAAPLVSARVSHDGKTRRDFGFGGGNKAVHAPRDINVVGDNNVVGGGGSSDASSVWGGHGFSGSWEGSSFNNQPPIIVVWANPGGEAATTQIEQQVTVTQTVTAPPAAGTPPPAAAATHTVMVGGDDLVYTPDQLNNVPIGDMVVFQFMQQNHTVTQSGFDTPCEAMEGGMDTEHQPNPDNSVEPPPQVAMQVTTTDPLWFYCKTANHCGMGMVFSINPTAEKSQEKFKQMAIAQNGDGAEAAPPAAGTPVASPPPAATPPAATPPAATPPAAGGELATPGQGVVGNDGSCHCVVSCSASGFASSGQGIGSIGGLAGSLPMGNAMSSGGAL